MALGLTPQQIIDKNTHPLLTISENWTRVHLNLVANVQNGYAFPSKDFSKNAGLPLIRIRDILKDETEDFYTGNYPLEFLVDKGDILIGMDGDFNASVWNGSKGLLNQRVCRVIPFTNNYTDKFLVICLQPYLNAINSETSAVTVKHLSSKTIQQIPLPLPPLPEQRAIVSKIEQLFSDLDNGIENFKKAQEQLKIYRQAVLKNACEGKLVPTEAELARAEGRDYEPADVLLERILEKRREKWNGKGKYKEPAAPDTSGLPELPEGWIRVSIGQVTESLDNLRIPINKKERAKRKGDIPYYGANGQVDWIDDYIFDEPLVLIVEDETFVGREKPFCYKITGKSWVNNHAHVLRANNAVNVDFLNYSLMYYPFTHLTTGTTGRRKLTKSVLMQAPYSLPPLAEQHRIVAEVERLLSICDKMEVTIAESLEKAESLRQSILKKAFEGKLLNEKELEKARNAPDWQPAEKLLERIKAEKTNTKRKNKGKK